MIRLFRFFKPYAVPFTAVLIVLFGQAMAELYLPTLMSDVVNEGMMKGNSSYIWIYGGYMLIVALASSLCAILGSFLSARIAVAFSRDLREKVFVKAEQYALHEFDTMGTSSMITRTTNDITQVQTLLVMGMRFMIYAPILCVGGIIMALSKDAHLTLILAIILPLMALTIGMLARFVVPLFKVMQVKLDTLNRVVRENLIGIRVIRAFDKQEVEKKRFDDANLDLVTTSIKVNRIMAAMQPVMMLFMNITSVAIIWFAGIRISDGNMELGDMMAFLQYAMQIMFSIIMVSIMFVMIPRAQASAVRINEVLDLEPEIKDTSEPKTANAKRGFIEFDNVTFYYPGAEEPALSNISFSAGPGQVTAIIGGTGAGKSTLINLIPRFYDIKDGTIKVNGVAISQMTQKDLRQKIGFVPQSAILFSGSVKENICFGKKEASMDEVIHASKIAQADDFISKMSQGYDAPISQGGTNLSGGQKQRLSIARALVRKPEIYIFDDSFSALDYKTDAKLRHALKGETKEATVIIVAQRVSTVKDADQIIVLDEGKIKAIGKHYDLLKTSDVYKEIVSSQLSEEEM